MKKLILLNFCLIMLLPFMACSKDDDNDAPVLGASVEVTVKNLLGMPHEGMTVYLYKNQEVDKNTKKADADRQVVTNSKGIAVFSLRFHELNIIEAQTTLHFAVFFRSGEEDHVRATTGVTVRRNDEKKVDIQTIL